MACIIIKIDKFLKNHFLFYQFSEKKNNFFDRKIVLRKQETNIHIKNYFLKK
jgi:hypothetical protein